MGLKKVPEFSLVPYFVCMWMFFKLNTGVLFPAASHHCGQQMWREEDRWAAWGEPGGRSFWTSNEIWPALICRMDELILILTWFSAILHLSKVHPDFGFTLFTVSVFRKSLPISLLRESPSSRRARWLRRESCKLKPRWDDLSDLRVCWGAKWFACHGSLCCVRQACDRLLSNRVETKMRGKKVHDVLNRLHLAMPTKRDEKVLVQVFLAASSRFNWPVV